VQIFLRGVVVENPVVDFTSSSLGGCQRESVCVPYIKLIKCRDTNVDMGENEDWKISLQASGSASA
jgi:hypothetical protein